MNVDNSSTSSETSRNDMAADASTSQISSTENYFTHYKMNHPKRGNAVIINQEFRDLTVAIGTTGTNVTCNKLIDTFTLLGFDTWNCQNFTFAQVVATLKKIAKFNHCNNDCLIVAVLSYGYSDYVSASDIYYKTDVLFNRFTVEKCPTLAGKPKLFFIQTRHPNDFMLGIPLIRLSSHEKTFNLESDYLIIHSTIPGRHSQSVLHGICFMEQLCSQLRENGTCYDLITLLTFIWQRIAEDFQSVKINCLSVYQKQQLPRMMSTLTHLIKFTPKSNSLLQLQSDKKRLADIINVVKSL